MRGGEIDSATKGHVEGGKSSDRVVKISAHVGGSHRSGKLGISVYMEFLSNLKTENPGYREISDRVDLLYTFKTATQGVRKSGYRDSTSRTWRPSVGFSAQTNL